MYIESVPNRQSPPAVLLRESYRANGKVRKRTLANLTNWPEHLVAGLRTLLKGGVAVERAEQALTISRSLPHGHVAAVLGTAERLGLPKLLLGRRARPAEKRARDLVLAMVAARILAPRSKLATVRALNGETASSSLGARLGLGEVRAHELYAALDWLVARQPHIESALANRHLSEGTLTLYDVSSSYLEGRCCELARHGYSRDHRPDRLQIVYGLLCDPAGLPIAVEVFEGDTADPATLTSQIDKLKRRFGLKRVVLVGDRGMITSARIREELEPAGLDWITALRAPAIRQLVDDGPLQLSLFDDRDLAEIAAPEQFPGERLMVCRNPDLADERARKREALLAATERALEKVKRAVQRSRAPLRGEAEIGQAVGAVRDRHKMAKHFEITITERSVSYRRKADSIAAEARLDGIYVVRTNVPADTLSAEQAVGAYKTLGRVERAFRSLKTVDLEIRPVFHWAAPRVRAHVFLCMLAYYVEAQMRARLAPILFDDHDPDAAAERPSVVAPAERSEAARRKAATRRTDDDLPVHSFQSLLDDLGTLCLNTVSLPSNPDYSFDQPTKPTPLQARAFELLGVSP